MKTYLGVATSLETRLALKAFSSFLLRFLGLLPYATATTDCIFQQNLPKIYVRRYRSRGEIGKLAPSRNWP